MSLFPNAGGGPKVETHIVYCFVDDSCPERCLARWHSARALFPRSAIAAPRCKTFEIYVVSGAPRPQALKP